MKEKIVLNYIKKYIKEHNPGDKLPSESSISKELDIPTYIVRNCIFLYREKGLIRTKRGGGSYITKYKKDKYIFITAGKNETLGIPGASANIVFSLLTDIIEKTNYLSYKHLTDEKGQIPIPISKIAGVISFRQNTMNTEEFEKHAIPIIDFADFKDFTNPTIYLNYQRYFFLLVEIINKYNFKNPLFFTLLNEIEESSPRSFTLQTTNRYFEQKYRLKYIQVLPNMSSSKKIVEDALSTIDFKPDLFIFLDDAIYKGARDIITQNKIYKDTKIITYSNEDIEFPDNVCRISFDLKKASEEAVQLLLQLINKETVLKPNVPINPYIINEEILNV
ncbi:MAG: hypothetical protein IJS60_08195 [Abditibacteriota bacterium]|nr:hypothetical protein [Abditibacteriota bacterium]